MRKTAKPITISPAAELPAEKKKSKAIHFRISAELAERLEEIAKENDITISSVAAIACARIAKSGI